MDPEHLTLARCIQEECVRICGNVRTVCEVSVAKERAAMMRRPKKLSVNESHAISVNLFSIMHQLYDTNYILKSIIEKCDNAEKKEDRDKGERVPKIEGRKIKPKGPESGERDTEVDKEDGRSLIPNPAYYCKCKVLHPEKL